MRLGELRRLPRCVIVRAIPAGTFEQVTLRLGLLHALEELGVLVVNRARAIERCVDKSATSVALAGAGLPTPATWAVESEAQAQRSSPPRPRPGDRLVVKPLFGAQGKGLRCIARPGGAAGSRRRSRGVCYLQRYVGREAAGATSGCSWWTGSPVAGMARHGTGGSPTSARGRPEPLAVRLAGRRSSPWPRPRRSAPPMPGST